MSERAIIGVIDNLESTSETDALSANQGRVLKEMIDDVSNVNVVNNLTSTSTTDALSSYQGKILNEKISEVRSELGAGNWNTLSLASGISEHNHSDFPCRFKKQGKIVFVEGAVKGISTSSGLLATLPAGYRPNRPFYYLQATSGGKMNTLKIMANGNIERVSTTNGTMSSNDYHFINISFIMN